MELNEYQDMSFRTAKISHTRKDLLRAVDIHEWRERVANFAMGMTGEAGEACDLLKKELFHGHTHDRAKLTKELGDVIWYVSQLARLYDITLEEIAQINIEKLKFRYPNGFKTEDSMNRRDE